MAILKSLINLFKPLNNLAKIINKCRLYNTFLAVCELICIIFYNSFAANTNQKSYISSMNFQAMVMIFACMYIHMSPKLANFTFSIELNMFVQFFLVKWTKELYHCFTAMSAACQMVWNYYDLKGQKPVFENIGDIIVTKQ